VFTCFLRISEQTAIIFLYSINWLVFVTETECVYCAVRTERLTVIHVTFHIELVRPRLRRLIAGLSPRRPRFDHMSVHVRCVMDKVALGRRFLRIFLFSLSVSLHKCLSICCSYQNERTKFGNVAKINYLSKIGDHYTNMHHDFFLPSDVQKIKKLTSGRKHTPSETDVLAKGFRDHTSSPRLWTCPIIITEALDTSKDDIQLTVIWPWLTVTWPWADRDLIVSWQ